MPISHKHKVIFVHIPKSGGSSIEYSLGIYAKNSHGDNTIVDDEILFGHDLQHLPMCSITSRLGEELTKNYFKFAIVRNPWDRMVSEYFWRAGWNIDHNKVSFYDFLSEYPSSNTGCAHFKPQVEFIYNSISDKNYDRCLVDFVGRFESLHEDFKKICGLAGIENVSLPKVNSSSRSSYRDYYDDRSIQIVRELYQQDINLFGYKF